MLTALMFACGGGAAGGFTSGQTGTPIMGPIVGTSMQDLWAPTVGSGPYDTGNFAHYDGMGWTTSDVPSFGLVYAAEGGSLWTASTGLYELAPDGTITDHTAELPAPLSTGAQLSLGGTAAGHVVVTAGSGDGPIVDHFTASGVEGGVVSELASFPMGATSNLVLGVAGPGDAYVLDGARVLRLRDGAFTEVPFPDWNPTMSTPDIVVAGPDDAWTTWFTVDAEGQGHQNFYHDDGTGFALVPSDDWDAIELGDVGALLPLPDGEVVVLSSRSGYGSQLYDSALLATHLFADGTVRPARTVFACSPNAGEPPCWVYPGNMGVLADGTIVMLSTELLWWYGPVDAL